MNKDRRNRLTVLMKNIDVLKEQLESIMEEEEEYYNNMPDNMKDGERGQQTEERVGTIQNAIDRLDEAMSAITEAAS